MNILELCENVANQDALENLKRDRDAERLTTDRVQVWLSSGTMLGVVSREKAQQLIREDRATFVSSQAIQSK